MGSAIRASLRAWRGELGLVLALHGRGRANDAGLCVAVADAERLFGVPPDVLPPISRTKTVRGDRPWPWTVHLKGQGDWFATRPEAAAPANTGGGVEGGRGGNPAEGFVALASAEPAVPRANVVPLRRGGSGPRLGSLVPLAG